MKCRNIAADLQHIRGSVASLYSLLQNQIELSNSISSKLDEQISECNNLKSQNVKLKKRLLRLNCSEIADLLSDDSGDSSDESSSDDDSENVTGHLIIGDSMLRNVQAKSDEVTIDKTSGAEFSNIAKKLKSLKTLWSHRFEHYLVYPDLSSDTYI